MKGWTCFVAAEQNPTYDTTRLAPPPMATRIAEAHDAAWVYGLCVCVCVCVYVCVP